jgi:hypothetical protein
MKVDILDAHDRYKHLMRQDFDIGACCQDIIDQRPFGDVPFYIFCHARTEDDGINKRVIWQPRLTKPKAMPNTMLFKVKPGSDNVRIVWVIPAPEIWGQFKTYMVTGSNTVQDSIHEYIHNRAKLEAREDDDLSDDKIDAIYEEISRGLKPSRPFESI